MKIAEISKLAKERLKQKKNITRAEVKKCINNSTLLSFDEQKNYGYRDKYNKGGTFAISRRIVNDWKFTIINYFGVKEVFDSSIHKYPNHDLTLFVANDLTSFVLRKK